MRNPLCDAVWSLLESGTCIAAAISDVETVASRLIEVFEGVCSASVRLGAGVRLVAGGGGGDLSRGEVGQAGEL